MAIFAASRPLAPIQSSRRHIAHSQGLPRQDRQKTPRPKCVTGRPRAWHTSDRDHDDDDAGGGRTATGPARMDGGGRPAGIRGGPPVVDCGGRDLPCPDAGVLGRHHHARPGALGGTPFLLAPAGLRRLDAGLGRVLPDPRTSFTDSKQLVLFLLVPAAYQLARGNRAITVFNVIITVGAASAILGIVQYGLLNYDHLGQRPQGTLGHYMTYSGLLVLVICAAVSRVLFDVRHGAWSAIVLPALAVAIALDLHAKRVGRRLGGDRAAVHPEGLPPARHSSGHRRAVLPAGPGPHHGALLFDLRRTRSHQPRSGRDAAAKASR